MEFKNEVLTFIRRNRLIEPGTTVILGVSGGADSVAMAHVLHELRHELSVSLHMARVFYTGAYKPPREFNWVVGVILLFLTLGLSFTGYLLPWDQLSIWAVTVGTSLAGYSPLVATQVKFILLGGVEVGPNTLLRWYVLHVLALPFVLVIFLAVHFWRIRKDGGISGPL